MRLMFLAIGDELLRGESRESNGAALAAQVAALGLRLDGLQVVGDDMAEIANAIAQMRSGGPVAIVVSGGLGPTDDDFSRQAIAAALGVGLQEDAEALAQITHRFAKLGRQMHPTNARQALIPVAGRLCENRHGTAPGFVCKDSGLQVIALPGVPREFAAMLTDHLPQFLRDAGLAAQPRQEVTLRLFGVPESDMQGALHALPDYGAAQMRSLPKWPEIRLKLASRGDDVAFARLLEQVHARLGGHIFGHGDDDSHAAATLRALQARGARVAVAESCTGGLIASMITDVPGASASFVLGVVAYANRAKTDLLDVQPDRLAAHGAVSTEVAGAMAQGALSRAGADVAVATSGIAGPGGGSAEKPVGTLCLAIADRAGVTAERVQFAGLDRQRFKVLAAHLALDRLRHWAQRQD